MERDALFEAVQKIVADQGYLAATEFVTNLGDEGEVVNGFFGLVMDYHHKAKATERVVHFGLAGIQYCLTRAAHHAGADDDRAAELTFKAKQMATNCASFTWPGWDEPGVTITPDQMRIGLDAGRFSVKLIHDLKRDDASLAFTLWFYGAQLMAHERYDEAIAVFGEAQELAAKTDGQADGAAMNAGYVGMAMALDQQSAEGESRFTAAISELERIDTEDSRFYAQQLREVRAVFEKRKAD